MTLNSVATDISWVLCFHDIPSRFPDDCEWGSPPPLPVRMPVRMQYTYLPYP